MEYLIDFKRMRPGFEPVTSPVWYIKFSIKEKGSGGFEMGCTGWERREKSLNKLNQTHDHKAGKDNGQYK